MLNGYPFLDNKASFYSKETVHQVWERSGRTDPQVLALHGNTVGSIGRWASKTWRP